MTSRQTQDYLTTKHEMAQAPLYGERDELCMTTTGTDVVELIIAVALTMFSVLIISTRKNIGAFPCFHSSIVYGRLDMYRRRTKGADLSCLLSNI